NIDDASVQEALSELCAQTSFLRVLGAYPARRPATEPARPASARPPLAAPLPAGKPLARPASVAMSSRQFRREDTVIQLGRASVGGASPVFIVRVGHHPDRSALLASARALAQAGAHVLRIADPLRVL